MTDLRDRRLARALDAAPDADLRPLPRTREAILAAAHQAVTPAWRRWWPAPGQRMPWNAALATVLLASLITVLWQGQEVPGARDAADRQAPETAREPAPAAVPAPASAPARLDMQTQTPARASAPPAVSPPVAAAPAATTAAPPPPQAPSTLPLPPPAPLPQEPDARAAAARVAEVQKAQNAQAERSAPAEPLPVPAAPPAAPVPASPPAMASTPAARAAPSAAAAAPALRPQQASSLAEAASSRDAASARGTALPAPAPAPAPAFALRAPALIAWADWTQARIESGDRSVIVPREQAAALAERLAPPVGRLADASPRSDTVGLPAAPVVLRVELARGAQPVATLEWTGSQWRLRFETGPVRDLGLGSEAAEALLQESQRLLAR